MKKINCEIGNKLNYKIYFMGLSPLQALFSFMFVIFGGLICFKSISFLFIYVIILGLIFYGGKKIANENKNGNPDFVKSFMDFHMSKNVSKVYSINSLNDLKRKK